MSGVDRKAVAIGIFAAAFLLRAAYSWHLPADYVEPDERVYSDLAANLLAGEGLVSNQDRKQDLFRPDLFSPGPARYRLAAFPPLYPIFLAGTYLAGVRSLTGMRILQSLLGAASCLVLLLLARRVAGADDRGEISAWTAAGIMAVYPPMIRYSALLLTETVFILLILASCLALLRFKRTLGVGALFSAGFITGLGILCRPTLIPFFALTAVWLFFRFRPRFRPAPIYILAAALTVVPWTVRNYLRLGSLIPVTSQGGSNLYLANNPLSRGGTVSRGELVEAGIFHLGRDEDEISYNRAYGGKALEFIRQNPIRFGRLSLRRLLWFYHLDGRRLDRWYFLLPFWLVLLAGLAGIRIARRRGWEWYLPASVIFVFTALHMVFLPEGRYRLPLMPFFFLFSAPALIAAVGRAKTILRPAGSKAEGKRRDQP